MADLAAIKLTCQKNKFFDLNEKKKKSGWACPTRFFLFFGRIEEFIFSWAVIFFCAPDQTFSFLSRKSLFFRPHYLRAEPIYFIGEPANLFFWQVVSGARSAQKIFLPGPARLFSCGHQQRFFPLLNNGQSLLLKYRTLK